MSLLQVGNTGNPQRWGDVVFVHGINGDGTTSWSTGQPDGFWPHWLANECYEIGVWSLTYPAAASGWVGTTMSLYDRGADPRRPP